MNCFEQNIECLKLNNMNLYKQMYEAGENTGKNEVERIYMESAINGENVMFVQKNGVGNRLNSSYSPTHEAKIWAQQFEFKNLSTTIAMFGLGNGLFVGELSKRLHIEDFIFIYEPSKDIFNFAMHNYDLQTILRNKNVILAVEGVNDFAFHSLLQCCVNLTNMFSQIQCAHPYYEELFPESNLIFWKEIRDIMMHTKINVHTEIKFGERIILNSLKNIKYMKESCTLSEIRQDIRTDIPAIIVAAGPSLTEEIEALKKAKGKVYLIVVDRILDYILDQGIEPDFIATVDPMKPIEYFTTRDNVTIPLLTEYVSNWEVLDQHKGKKIFYNCGGYIAKMYQAAQVKPPSLLTGASVATVAFSACLQLGFEKIVLVGQDLAFEGDYTHAGGVAEKVRDTSHVVMVEGMDGTEVRSRYDWKEFLTWFKDMIIMNPDVTVIDTKKKGAKIQGSISMPLSEVIEQYGAKDKPINIDRDIEEHRFTFDDKSYRKIVKFFRTSYDEFVAIKRKSKEALELCDKQIRAYTRSEEENELTTKNFDKISKINKYIENTSAYNLIDGYIVALAATEISKIYQFGENDQENKINTYQKSKAIYEAMIAGVEYTLPKLEEELKKLENK